MSQTNMLRAHENGLGNQVTAMPVVIDAGTYAIATLMAKWPPGSSLLVIRFHRRDVLPEPLLRVMQLSEPRYQPIPNRELKSYAYESAIGRSASGSLMMIQPLLLVMTFSCSSVFSSRQRYVGVIESRWAIS